MLHGFKLLMGCAQGWLGADRLGDIPASNRRVGLLLLAIVLAPAPAIVRAQPTAAEVVGEVLSRPEGRLNYLDAATAFDRLIDKDSDITTTRATVARLVDAARQMAGPKPSDAYKLAAVRKAIYAPGAWNHNRGFSYDLADPLGGQPGSKLLSTYVRTRKGNCVSMPILFLIVADRMGLKVGLGAAPLHLFVRYTDPAGTDHNLEATSGGHRARDEWYRQNLPMSDRAIESGIYMRTLSKRETVAAMATSVMDFLLAERRYQEAVNVADAILGASPRDAYSMVKRGSAMAHLMQTEYHDRYPDPALVPPALVPRYRLLAEANQKAFSDAEALGWAPPQ
jgi:regulator of sirC expression with transglutaminase-like and TPR domain